MMNMINNNRNSKSSVIRLSDVLSVMWKDKKLFLSVSIFFMFLGYIYGLTFNKNIEFTSSVTINEPSIEFFSNYKPFFDDSSADFDDEKFFTIFTEKILSSNNLEKFVEQNKEIDEFKAYLRKNGITSKEYFQGKLVRQIRKIDKKTRNLKKYSLTYPEILDGDKFFNEYIIYTNNTALKEFNKQNQFLLKNIITLYEQNFNIALSIDLTNPLIQNIENDIKSTAFMSVEPESLFYQGTKVLKQRIINLKYLLKKFENNIKFNPIVDDSIIIGSNFVKVTWFPFYGLIIGIFLSFMITIFRVL
jgi:hypothetical protein